MTNLDIETLRSRLVRAASDMRADGDITERQFNKCLDIIHRADEAGARFGPDHAWNHLNACAQHLFGWSRPSWWIGVNND